MDEPSGASSNIAFEGESLQQPEQPFQAEVPKIVQWTMRHSGGLIKNEEQANYVLLGFAALAILVSLFLVFGGNGKQPGGSVDPETGRKVIPGQIPGTI
ncbi:MAG: hypothetical protein WC798_02030 [Candidatus Paceibacterota bacterium]|jgi:hypothetical protein